MHNIVTQGSSCSSEQTRERNKNFKMSLHINIEHIKSENGLSTQPIRTKTNESQTYINVFHSKGMNRSLHYSNQVAVKIFVTAVRYSSPVRKQTTSNISRHQIFLVDTKKKHTHTNNLRSCYRRNELLARDLRPLTSGS